MGVIFGTLDSDRVSRSIGIIGIRGLDDRFVDDWFVKGTVSAALKSSSSLGSVKIGEPSSVYSLPSSFQSAASVLPG